MPAAHSPDAPVATAVPTREQRWHDRKGWAFLVRALVLLVPLAGSFAVAWWLSSTMVVPGTFGLRLARWILIAALSTGVVVVLQRVMRRFVPLATLLALTLVFPDRAPSRFRVALRGRSTADLQLALAQADRNGLGDTPREAAEHLVELVGQLSRHDRLTRGHSERVRAYTDLLAEQMNVDPAARDRLRWAGLLHDVGKLYVPSEILNKPGELTSEEFEVVKTHPEHGRRLVAGLSEWLGESARAVHEHHERWAGGGYPAGVAGTEIALESRIVSVADAFDVMTSTRSYKAPIPAAAAREELQRCAGSQFDPAVVRAMLGVSLGSTWRVMGPLAWLAQLPLFPRSVVQSVPTLGSAATVAIGLGVASLTAAIVEGPASVPPVAAPEVVVPTIAPSTGPPSGALPPGPTVTTPSRLPHTGPSDPTLPPAQSGGADPPRASPPPAVATTGPAATTPVEVLPATTVGSTPVTTGATIPPTTPPSTPPVTAPPSTIAPPVGTLVLASSGQGDTASTAALPLEPARSPANSGLPNYDTDRNSDPGLTVARTLNALETPDATGVQTWRFPAGVNQISGRIDLTVYVAQGAPVLPGDEMVVRAGIFDCPAPTAHCRRLARSTRRFQPVEGTFVPISFDLTPGALPAALAPGHWLELRLATMQGSAADAWIAYDAPGYPSTLTVG